MASTNRAMAVSEVSVPSWHGHLPEDEFEAFVLGLFSEDDFLPVHPESRYGEMAEVDEADGIDLRFTHIRSGNEIWVKCHYQKDAVNKVLWCSEEELRYLQELQDTVRPSKLYVLIGLGGEPTRPKHMFCVPLEQAKWPAIYVPVLRLFEHDVREPFRLADGTLI